MRYFLSAMTALAFFAAPATSATLASPNYNQNFDSLANSGTSNTTLPAGWAFKESGDNANGAYRAGNGSINTGDIYSFGDTGSTDRAFGSLGSRSITEVLIGAFFTNGLGATITDVAIAYFGEQWRAGTSTTDGLGFSYSLDATALDNGTWISVSALDFAPLVTSGNTALDGNAAANRTFLSSVISGLSIADGQSFAIRWRDLDSSGSDHGLAIDDLSIVATTAGAVPEPASWAMMIGGLFLVGGALRGNRRRIAFA